MIKYIPFLLLPIIGSAQEYSSISGICKNYELVEYVLLGKGDTTAAVSRANIPADLGLENPSERHSDEDGEYTIYYRNGLRIIYLELNDGRTGTTISRL